MGGMTSGTMDVSLPVFTYRYWPGETSSNYIVLLVVYNCAKLIYPLLIQASAQLFGTYHYALFVMSAITVFAALMAVVLPTPQHDELRSINAALERCNSDRNAKDVQKALSTSVALKRSVVFCLALLSVLYGVVQSGVILHITVYCDQYLAVDPGFGRYLVSTFNGGQLVYRCVVLVPNGKIKDYLKSTDFAKRYLAAMIGVVCGMLLLWIVVPMEWKLMALFPLFAIMGSTVSGFWPYSIRLVESVTPYSGTISCVFIMCYGIGDTLIVMANGELIQIFGAFIQPVPILVACLFGCPLLALTLFLRQRYIQIQELVISVN